MGFFKDRPSIDVNQLRPLPVRRGAPSAKSCHTLRAFRPCRFARLRRLTPQLTAQVCCTLLPIVGSTVFQARRPSPTMRTLRSFPLTASATVSLRRCPHDVGATNRTSTSGPCSDGESVARQRCCHRSGPVAPLGLPQSYLPKQSSDTLSNRRDGQRTNVQAKEETLPHEQQVVRPSNPPEGVPHRTPRSGDPVARLTSNRKRRPVKVGID